MALIIQIKFNDCNVKYKWSGYKKALIRSFEWSKLEKVFHNLIIKDFIELLIFSFMKNVFYISQFVISNF